MEFQDEKLIAFGSQYLNNWTECLEIIQELQQELQLIGDRQRQRFKDGFSPNNHPQNRPGFRSLSQNIQFEQRQMFEKLVFENQTDEQAKNLLNQQWKQAKDREIVSLECVDELQSVFENLSRIVYAASAMMDVEEEQTKP